MNNNLTEKALTPAQILNSGISLQVPIYQRLFVWEQQQIEKLLNDLLRAYQKQNEKKYYIGIITVNEQQDNTWEVVDGQQRLTFLTLFGAMCIQNGYMKDEWEKFLYFPPEKGTLRINYFCRKEDQEDIEKIASKQPIENVKNINFSTFIECFNRLKIENYWKAFSEFVFYKTSFFVSQLPQQYKPRQLNLFFEKMNSAGRQLEPVDLIKIKFADYASRWNACMDFDKAFTKPQEPEDAKSQTGEESLSLAKILEKKSNIKIEQEKSWEPHIGNQLILKPEIFLLHVLRLATKNTDLSLNGDKLQEIFRNNFGNNKVDEKNFIQEMGNYRAWLDKNIIFLSASEKHCPYSFRKDDASDVQKNEDDDKDIVMRQFQSMLYVSSDDSQKWVIEAYEECLKQNQPLTLDLLRHQDLERHKLPKLEEMTYQNIDRYWFWKLDYLLWKASIDNKDDFWRLWADKKEDFTQETKKIIRGYVFRRNRSIEHLQAQANAFSPQDIEHSFGNLAMISPGTNSSLSDNSINTKFGRIQDILNNGGQLESIKLLCMFLKANGEWTEDKAKRHGEEMYNLLAKDESEVTKRIQPNNNNI